MSMLSKLLALSLFVWLLSLSAVRGGELPEKASAPAIKVATFDVDATPPLGSAMAYDPVKRLDELTLRCRGIAILGAGKPIILCAVDWIGIANEGHDQFRESLADAAGTTRDRVAVHALHQHDAPGCDFTAERLIRDLGLKDFGRFDGGFHREVMQRAGKALKSALGSAQPATHYGWGVARVKEVASNRRILGPDGKVRAVRYTATTDPALRAEPEGVIDPEVSLLSFWNENKPIAVLTYYACHPQSYYRTGVPSPDFPGIARFIRGQSVPEALHVHFNGAGGNIGAGKYNDGSKPNRMVLAQRLADGMKQAFAEVKKQPLGGEDVGWETVPVKLPVAPHLKQEELIKDLKTEPARGYVSKADQLAWVVRCKSGHAIDIACLRVGQARVLHMPGELFVEYQLAAKKMRPDLHVAMAAYGDYGPAYIGTTRAYAEGGYETSPRASNVAPQVEPILVAAMTRLLETRDVPAGESPARLPRDNLLLYRGPEGKPVPVKTAEDWAKRRAEVLRGAELVMGKLPGAAKRCALDMKVEEETNEGTYVRRLITYASEPGGRVPAYLLVPRAVLTGDKKAPAVLCLHPTDNAIGHGTVVGLGARANRAYAKELAERGFVTLAPSYPLLAKYQPDLKKLGWESGTLKAVWDNMRGLDLLTSLPFVDATRGFGTIGHSLGGHNSVYTALFDNRLRVVVSSCGLDSYLDYYRGDPKNWEPEKGWCQTRYMLKLAEYKGRLADVPFDFHEMIGALAPRHVLIVAPTKDSNFRAESVDRIAAAAAPVFKLLGHEERLRVEHPDCGHDFPSEMRELAYKLFDKVLAGRPAGGGGGADGR